MADDKQNGSTNATETKTTWTIWVAAGYIDPLMIRTTLENVPLGQVFEQAAKYCRDEGWNRIEITRVLV